LGDHLPTLWFWVTFRLETTGINFILWTRYELLFFFFLNVVQADLEFVVLQPHPPECWDCRYSHHIWHELLVYNQICIQGTHACKCSGWAVTDLEGQVLCIIQGCHMARGMVPDYQSQSLLKEELTSEVSKRSQPRASF
jgi:hypothetical protein